MRKKKSLIVSIFGATIGVPPSFTASPRYFVKKTWLRLFGKMKHKSEILPRAI